MADRVELPSATAEPSGVWPQRSRLGFRRVREHAQHTLAIASAQRTERGRQGYTFVTAGAAEFEREAIIAKVVGETSSPTPAPVLSTSQNGFLLHVTSGMDWNINRRPSSFARNSIQGEGGTQIWINS